MTALDVRFRRLTLRSATGTAQRASPYQYLLLVNRIAVPNLGYNVETSGDDGGTKMKPKRFRIAFSFAGEKLSDGREARRLKP